MKIDIKKFEIALAKSCMSITELAEASGVDDVTLSRMRNKKQEPRPRTIGKIAKILQVDVIELIEN